VSRSEALRSAAVADRLAAIAALTAQGSADPEELAALVECLAHPAKAVARRAAEACGVLSRRGVGVRDVLLRHLTAPDMRRRWGAAFALSMLGEPPPESAAALLEALGCDDGDIRWAAADILRRLQGRPDLLDRLCALLREGNAAQRKMAAYCLRDLDARRDVVAPALSAALDDSEPAVRLAAMSALARLCVDRAAAARRIALRLSDVDAGVQRAAAATLGQLGERSEPVLAALRAAAGSSDTSLQRAANRSLRILG